jgi:hypothetical protein
MNYLAHSLACLADPYQVAGAAIPDWLGMTRPRLRCRSRHAQPFIDAEDQRLASIAQGVVRHHADDDWFHQTAAFGDLSLELARQVRAATGDDDGMRPSFLGHILVELLLDAAIIADDRSQVDGYYLALAEIDPEVVAAGVTRMTGSDGAPLASLIERFIAARFLYDYEEDGSLTYRLNQVMRRVGLCELPLAFLGILPVARELVAAKRSELLTPASPTAAGDSLLASQAR